jgi:hypothetical protein
MLFSKVIKIFFLEPLQRMGTLLVVLNGKCYKRHDVHFFWGRMRYTFWITILISCIGDLMEGQIN